MINVIVENEVSPTNQAIFLYSLWYSSQHQILKYIK